MLARGYAEKWRVWNSRHMRVISEAEHESGLPVPEPTSGSSPYWLPRTLSLCLEDLPKRTR